jgi:hypothetical protein
MLTTALNIRVVEIVNGRKKPAVAAVIVVESHTDAAYLAMLHWLVDIASMMGPEGEILVCYNIPNIKHQSSLPLSCVKFTNDFAQAEAFFKEHTEGNGFEVRTTKLGGLPMYRSPTTLKAALY